MPTERTTALGTHVHSPLAIPILVLLLAAGCTTADLRTDALKENGLTESAAERGRELLQEVARTHGLDAWREHATLQYEAVDHFAWGWLSQEWWPANPQRFRARTVLGTFTSRVRLLDGPQRGTTWGIQQWQAYAQSAPNEPIRRSESTAIEFYLPTLHYFTELPFRLLRADVVVYAGTRSLNGQPYDLVLVTWDQLAPSLEHDQYLLWIDRETKRLEICRYTLRDAYDWATGTIFFDDYRTVQGVSVPFRQTVTLAGPTGVDLPVDENYFHQLRLSSARFDAVPASHLVVDTLDAPADTKPPGYSALDPLN